MDRNVRIAKELVRLAKQLAAGDAFGSSHGPVSMQDAVKCLKDYQREVKFLKQKFGGVAMAMNAETRGVEGTDWSQNSAVKVYYKVNRPNNVSLDTAASRSDSVEQYNKETYGKWKLFRVYENDGNADDGNKKWKLYRVKVNGGRELVTSLDLNGEISENGKMDAMEREIAKTGFEIPDDCDFYVENSFGNEKYVLRHDNGSVEFEMCFDPSQAKKVVNGNGNKAIVTRLDFDRNATDEDKINVMEQEIKKTHFEIPEDCDFYVENEYGVDKYVLRHDDGRVEFEMYFDPSYTKKDERGDTGKKELDKLYSGVNIPAMVDSNALGLLDFSFTMECKPVGQYRDNNGNQVNDLSPSYKFTVSGQYDCKRCVANGTVGVVDASGRFFLGFSSVESFSVNYQDEGRTTLFEAVKAKFDKIVKTMDQNRVRIASKHGFSRGFLRMARRIARLLDEI